MKLIKEHLDIGVEVWLKSHYTHKNPDIPCTIIGFERNKSDSMMVDNCNMHSGNRDYYYKKNSSELLPIPEDQPYDKMFILECMIERIAYPDLSKFIGRKVKSLVDNLFSGDLKKGDIGIIMHSSHIKFPKQNILCSQLFYGKDEWNKFELLPEECKLETLELKPWQKAKLEEVFDYTKIFKKEENLLDKYEHQVIKLSKPRTKNKLIIL